MQELQKALKLATLVYVTRDLERAIGLPKNYQNYHIITNSSPFGREYSKKHKNILLVKAPEKLDTRELLRHPSAEKYLKKLKKFNIVVFKNTAEIERICAEKGWKLLNPSAALASRVEEKISQLHWLGALTKYLPPHHIQECQDLLWSGEPYIVQFNRAHTGTGTILIENEKQIHELKEKFPKREVRVTQFIKGAAYTANIVVWGKKILVGNVNYQITGLSPFTQNTFSTIGNDWALPHKLLKKKQIKKIETIATDIGKKLGEGGWKGLFGIDVIAEEKTGNVYLIEINARQPASTTYESQLQQTVISNAVRNLVSKRTRSLANARDDNKTTIEAHFAALLGLQASSYKLQTIKDGAQIIDRVKEIKSKEQRVRSKIKKLEALKLNTIPYDNAKPGEDLLRIQSKKGIMEDHNTFNKLGIKIANTLTTNY